MTLDEIDRELAGWQARLRRIDENLVALETDQTHQLLDGAGADGLEGVTRERVAPALAAMRELFAQRGLLDDVLAQAQRLRAGLSRLWPGDGAREIERLLCGPSIVLPGVEMPLARRGLLDAAETSRAITPEQLVAAMVASFEQARDAVAAVDEAWQRLGPGCDRAVAEADRLERLAADLGGGGARPLAAVRARVDAVRRQIARDPLGAGERLTDDVMARLQRVAQELAGLQGRRDRTLAHLAAARAALNALRESGRRVAEAYERRAREIAPPPDDGERPAPDTGARIEGLAGWLASLETAAGSRSWGPAGVGLERWSAEAGALGAELEAAERRLTAPLDERDELLGRLLARRQQSRVLAGRGRPADPALEQLAARAEALLRQVPTRLAEASALVADYERRRPR